MLKNSEKKCATANFGAKLLVVRGRRFNNSAAKFWSALIDELLAEYADCRHIALEAVNEGRLDPELLFPEVGLQRELNRSDLSDKGINEAWQQALADFELYGPPGSVGMRVYSSSGKEARLTLPMDCVDAEIFLYLLAWLLEWSDLPLSAWNEPKVAGSFSAADPGFARGPAFCEASPASPIRPWRDFVRTSAPRRAERAHRGEPKASSAEASPVRKIKYLFDFAIEHKPLSEGLFVWRLDLKFERSSSRSGILPPASLETQSTRR